MPKNIIVKGNGILDEEQRHSALQALQDQAETVELVKLQGLLNNPSLRAMLKSM